MDNNLETKKKNFPHVEIFIIAIVIFLFGMYLYPKITLSLEQKQYGRIQTNAAMFTSKVLGEFSDNTKKSIPTEVAKKLSDEMNKICKNPVDKKNPAYSVAKECSGCVVVAPDDKQKSITLTAKDPKDGSLILRTVIQPPSFVTYNKDLKNNDRK